MDTSKDIVPTDSRYTPFTQQPYCCVPTSISMIMYRHGIPLMSTEELGYHLGLTVPPEDEQFFYNVRVAKQPPSAAGYGTQIYNPDYEPNKVFERLAIPLSVRLQLATDIPDEATLLTALEESEANDTDALLCFNHGVIRGEYRPNTGHVVVFDRIVDGKVRIVDPNPKHPKWRLVEPELLLEAIRRHGNGYSGGVWHFRWQA